MMMMCWFLRCFMSLITRDCALLLYIFVLEETHLSLSAVKAHDSSLVTMFIGVARTFPELHEAIFCTTAFVFLRVKSPISLSAFSSCLSRLHDRCSTSIKCS